MYSFSPIILSIILFLNFITGSNIDLLLNKNLSKEYISYKLFLPSFAK